MYRTKNRPSALNIPPNYNGNAFRTTDDAPPDSINENENENESEKSLSKRCEKTAAECNDHSKANLLTLFDWISLEDILLLGVILVIHKENPTDTTPLLLLLLLLVK